MSDANQTQRWRETGRLAAATLGASLIIILLLVALAGSGAAATGYPTGLVLAATALPFILVVVVFWFVRRQDMIDRRHGMFED